MSSHRRRRSSGYGGVVRRVRRPKRIAKTYANLHLHRVHITDLIENSSGSRSSNSRFGLTFVTIWTYRLGKSEVRLPKRRALTRGMLNRQAI